MSTSYRDEVRETLRKMSDAALAFQDGIVRGGIDREELDAELARRALECLDGPDGCRGDVEYRTSPDRDDFRRFPRCEAHFDKRLDQAEKNLELLSDVPPSWFDPTYAGERWSEDY